MTTETCRVCGSQQTRSCRKRSIDRPLEPDDFRISDSRYGLTLELWRCEDCGFVFAPASEVNELERLYEDLEDPGYAESQESRSLQMRWLVDLARRHAPQARSALDIGAGAGLLVREARAAGLDAEGVEPSRWLVEQARRLHGIDLRCGVYPHPELEGRRFDIVFLVDVIEHVAHPVELLRAGRGALEPGGVFVVVTPDVSSVAARILRGRWWHYRLAHVGFFDRASLARAARAAGLTVTSWTRARWFFQVRYLAERTARYLPVGAINRLAERTAPLRWIYDRIVPLNLHDSWVATLTRDDSASPEASR